MTDVDAVNAFLQLEMDRRSMNEVAAVEAASWLEEEGLLRDSTQRRAKPLRDLLRAGLIGGQRQDPNSRRWFIDLQRPRRYWILCSHPDKSRIEMAISESEPDVWTTKRSDLRPGDRVAIWRYKGRTDKRGIVALGEVLSAPEMRTDPHPEHWIDPSEADTLEPRVDVRYVLPPNVPLCFEESELLQGMKPAKAQGGTVFSIEEEEWESLLSEVGGWPSEELESITQAIRAESGKAPLRPPRLSSEVRRAIELHAMKRAIAFYESQQYSVEDVSSTESYDLVARRGGETVHVEVKGSRGEGQQVFVTANEVRHAQTYGHSALVVVSDIRITDGDRLHGGLIHAEGGILRRYDPWRIGEGELRPLSYAYSPTGGGEEFVEE